MTKQELEKMAYAGAKLPSDLGRADTLHFLSLRALYSFAKTTGMDAEQGRREKARIEEEVRICKADERAAAYRAEQLNATSMSRANYRKARSAGDAVAALTAADRIVEALDNIPIESG